MARACSLILAVCLLLFASGHASADSDITGIWSVTNPNKSTRMLIERSGSVVRVALVKAKSVGAKQDWYIGSGQMLDDLHFSAKLVAYKRVGTKLKKVDTISLDISLSTSFVGSATSAGKTYDIERRPLTPNGLSSALIKYAPETGFYASSRTFVEVQNQYLYAYRMGFSRTGTAASLLQRYKKTGTISWRQTGVAATKASRLAGNTSDYTQFTIRLPSGKKFRYLRSQLWLTNDPVEDKTASLKGSDANYNHIRDDIEQLLTTRRLKSARLRGALREIAAAYGEYLYYDTPYYAPYFQDRIDIAKSCLAALYPHDADASIFLIESLVFNTDARHQARLSFLDGLGSRLTGNADISLTNPSACTDFMPGVTRRYGNTTAAMARAAQRLNRSEPSSAVSPNLRQRLASGRQTRQVVQDNKCSSYEVVVVTGVSTNQDEASASAEELAKVLGRAGVDSGIPVTAVADNHPLFLEDIVQVLVQNSGFTLEDARDMVFSAFRYIRTGFNVVKASKSGPGIAVGNLVISAGVLKLVAAAIGAEAVLANASDEANLAFEIQRRISDGKGVAVVAHSRGNLRIRAVYHNYLNSTEQKSLEVAAIANAAPDVVKNRGWATRNDDWVIKWAPGAAPTNYDAGNDPWVLLGHSFVDSYLNAPISGAKVISLTKAALANVILPSSSGAAIFLELVSGGYTPAGEEAHTYDVGVRQQPFSVEYEAYSIPDQFDIRYGSAILATTGGLVSGSGTLNASVPATGAEGTQIIVAVHGPDPGTAWTFRVKCPTAATSASRRPFAALH